MDLLEVLNWRYATKRMNGKKVQKEKIEIILEAIRLAPSSYGLQPYTVIIIEDAKMRKEIQPIANNQPQFVECSHILVFAAWDGIRQEQIDDYFNMIIEARGITAEALKDFKKTVEEKIKGKTKNELFEWNARQAYIALGTALAATALEKVDSTPIEGFDNQKLDELLHLQSKGLKSVVILTLGYRDEKKDYLAKAKKVRRPKNKLFLELTIT